MYLFRFFKPHATRVSAPPAGQTLYGRVLWNPEQNLNAGYRLQLEKVYLCTGRDGYVPFFDPTGTLYNEGPQYGCIQPNKNLKHRFLLLVSAFFFLFASPLLLLCVQRITASHLPPRWIGKEEPQHLNKMQTSQQKHASASCL